MTTHQVNLEYLAEAANLLMGPQGALRLSVVYTVIENVAARAHTRGVDEGFEDGFSSCMKLGQQEEAEEIEEAYRVADQLLTLNEAAHGDDDVTNIDLHKTHYDTWNGRFHRPGEE